MDYLFGHSLDQRDQMHLKLECGLDTVVIPTEAWQANDRDLEILGA